MIGIRSQTGDIAERAEVGRSTFFRYFGDKQEVLFADDHRVELVERLATQVKTGPPIGDSLLSTNGSSRSIPRCAPAA